MGAFFLDGHMGALMKDGFDEAFFRESRFAGRRSGVTDDEKYGRSGGQTE
jgi:hypothetical protein